MKIFKYISVTLSIVALTNCDPGMRGNLKVFNETNQILSVKTVYHGGGDTTYKDIQPNSNEAVVVLGGLGDKKHFDCCPCVIIHISIKSPLGPIKKDPKSQDNWSIPNKGNLKKYGGEDVKCEFYVTQADL